MKKGFYVNLLLVLICISVLFLNIGRAQTYPMSTGTVTTCTGTFYDSGGVGGSATTTNKPGNYADNENKTMTFCSSNAAQSIIITFTAFNIETSFDNMKVYNGPNTGSPLIGTYTGTTSPGTVYSAPGGCVTFNFKSDGSNNYLGWAATISCGVPPNQDCVTKKALCGTTSLNDNTNGYGTQEINASNGGCFTASSANETQSSWYQLTMANSGTFNFNITPNNGTDDDDWAIWGPNPACPPNAAPLRCTTRCYGSAVNCAGSSAPTPSTGMNTTATDVSENSGAGDGWVKQLNVLAGEVYILMVNNATSSNSGFQITFGGTAALTNCPLLPVELLDFTAKAEKRNVRLEWRIASEVNSAYYQVERSADGVYFESIEEPVKAAGVSNSLHLYGLFDQHPLPGTSYYRLKEVDMNGKIKLSEIQIIQSGINAAKLFNIYPNPLLRTSTELGAEFICELNELNVKVSLSNMMGQLLFNQEQKMIQGYNKVSIPLSSLELSKGVYFLRITSGYDTQSYKIVVE